MIEKENLEHYAWITRGTQRMAVLRALSKVMSPSLIRKASREFNHKISLPNTSDILGSFVKRGLAICLNNDAKRGRLYKLTKTGEEIRAMLIS